MFSLCAAARDPYTLLSNLVERDNKCCIISFYSKDVPYPQTSAAVSNGEDGGAVQERPQLHL